MKTELLNILSTLRKTKILENYAWTSVVNVLSPLIGFVVYPIVIRRLGLESYGLYIFILNVMAYAVQIISFGLDTPVSKEIVDAAGDKTRESRTVSSVLFIKSALTVFSILILSVFILIFIDSDHEKLLYFWAFPVLLTEIFNMQWYFQGINKLRVVSIINILLRILLIPLAFFLVCSPEDNIIYMILTSTLGFIGGLAMILIMVLHEHIRLTLPHKSELRHTIKIALPFFSNYFIAQLKTSSLTVLIGTLIGMNQVAVFDLGNKIVIAFRSFTQSINKVIFPYVLSKADSKHIKQVLRYESIISVMVISAIIALGYPIVIIIGGSEMALSYPIAILLSSTIFVYLIVDVFVNFVFVPGNKYYYVTFNQLVSLTSSLISFISLFYLMDYILPNYTVISAALSVALSGLAEVMFCRHMAKKIYQH